MTEFVLPIEKIVSVTVSMRPAPRWMVSLIELDDGGTYRVHCTACGGGTAYIYDSETLNSDQWAGQLQCCKCAGRVQIVLCASAVDKPRRCT